MAHKNSDDKQFARNEFLLCSCDEMHRMQDFENSLPLGRWVLYYSGYSVERACDQDGRNICILSELAIAQHELAPLLDRDVRRYFQRSAAMPQIVIYEETVEHRELIISTDLTGSLPVFLLDDGDTPRALASSPALLARSFDRPFTLDPTALAQWVICGYIASHRTIMQDIKRMRSATSLNLSDNESHRYWRWGEANFTERSEIDQRNKLDALLDQAILRSSNYAPGSTVMLSGGYDSRSLAMRLERLAPKQQRYFTFGAPDDQDRIIATDFAGRNNLPLATCRRDYSRSLEQCRTFVRKFGDMSDNVLATFIGVPEALEPLAPSSIWLGLEAFSTVLPRHPPAIMLSADDHDFERGVWMLTNAVSRKCISFSHLLSVGLFKDEMVQELATSFQSLVEDCIPRQDEDWSIKFDQLSLDRRFRIWNSNRVLFGMVAPTIVPFLDMELLDFYSSLPPSLRGERYLYLEANRASSAYADVPFVTGRLGGSHITELWNNNFPQALWRELRASAPGLIDDMVDQETLARMLGDATDLVDKIIVLRFLFAVWTFQEMAVSGQAFQKSK